MLPFPRIISTYRNNIPQDTPEFFAAGEPGLAFNNGGGDWRVREFLSATGYVSLRLLISVVIFNIGVVGGPVFDSSQNRCYLMQWLTDSM